MVHKSVLGVFLVAAIAFAVFFALTFGAVSDKNAAFGVIAFIGLLAVILFSMFQDMKLTKKDVSIALWYRILSVVTLVGLTWFCTRLGTLWGWW